MWRLFHQIHHSPQRVDMSGAALFHPLETIVFLLIGALVTTLVLGLDPVAAALTGYIAAFYGYFQHMNIRTPQWLGYIIQRPEAHCIHHQRDVHAFNYGDLPVWDMLFGTFRNPAGFEGEVGFDQPATKRFGAMLGFVDVNEAVAGPDTLGRKVSRP
jgi:sterol desaturase/sphingolipid hydroxylase (fatty acid hydroxylase superfamily)